MTLKATPFVTCRIDQDTLLHYCDKSTVMAGFLYHAITAIVTSATSFERPEHCPALASATREVFLLSRGALLNLSKIQSTRSCLRFCVLMDSASRYIHLGPLRDDPDLQTLQTIDLRFFSSQQSIESERSLTEQDYLFWSFHLGKLLKEGFQNARIPRRAMQWISIDRSSPKIYKPAIYAPVIGADRAIAFEHALSHGFVKSPRNGMVQKALRSSIDGPSVPNSRRLRLPPPQLALLEPRSQGTQHPLSIDELSILLFLSAGCRILDRRGCFVQRFVATAGNLGSVSISVLLHGGVAAERSEVMIRYRPHRHDCILISPEVRKEELLAHGEVARFYLTGDLERLTMKYGAFGLKLLYLDCGMALQHLTLVAERLGYAIAPLPLRPKLLDSKDAAHEVLTLKASLVSAGNPTGMAPPQVCSREMVLAALSGPQAPCTLEELALLLCNAAPAGADGDMSSHKNGFRESRVGDEEARPTINALLQRRSKRLFTNDPGRLSDVVSSLLVSHREDTRIWGVDEQAQLCSWILVGGTTLTNTRLYRLDCEAEDLVSLGDVSYGDRFMIDLVSAQSLPPLTIWFGIATSSSLCRADYCSILTRIGSLACKTWLLLTDKGFAGTINAGLGSNQAERVLQVFRDRPRLICALQLDCSR